MDRAAWEVAGRRSADEIADAIREAVEDGEDFVCIKFDVEEYVSLEVAREALKIARGR